MTLLLESESQAASNQRPGGARIEHKRGRGHCISFFRRRISGRCRRSRSHHHWSPLSTEFDL